jgi:hypothetical protein
MYAVIIAFMVSGHAYRALVLEQPKSMAECQTVGAQAVAAAGKGALRFVTRCYVNEQDALAEPMYYGCTMLPPEHGTVEYTCSK